MNEPPVSPEVIRGALPAGPGGSPPTFEETWTSPPGLLGWITAVNNQPLGRRFMGTALVFLLVGGVLALLLRVQLAVPENDVLGPRVYNELFTMHGSTMMFLFAVPFLEGLAIYLLPMMIGSRDMAFPRLGAFGWWTYLFGGLVFYASFAVGAAPDSGWFAYTPLSGPRYAGLGMDFWVLGLTLVEVGGLCAGAEIVVTVLLLRAPGMSLARMPLFAWAFLVTGVMIVFAFTTLITATTLLELDRVVGTCFYDPTCGGSSLLWQHLFWFFGHPDVYILFLPAAGAVSTILAASTGRPIVGYSYVALALVVIGFVSFGLWAHHMFAVGLPDLADSFYSASSLAIAVASGVQVFAWIATIWGARPRWSPPFLYILGFLFVFVLGGLTGVMVAIVPFDRQVHDTYFVVAHLHYVLIGGVLFPILAALHHWLPKITGHLPSERLGRWSFWLSFVGINLTFFPMHAAGMLGMPRRVYTYPAGLGLDGLNLASTVGAFVLGAGTLLALLNAARSLLKGDPAGPNPWNAPTLEWSVPSPPPIYTFRAPPLVGSRHPLWRAGEPPDAAAVRASEALDGAPTGWRATLSTHPVTGAPRFVQPLPSTGGPPFFVALGLLFACLGVLTKLYVASGLGALVALVALWKWLYGGVEVPEADIPAIEAATGLPVGGAGRHAVGFWGMVALLTVLAMLFATLWFSWFYVSVYVEAWPPPGLAAPRPVAPGVAVALLAASLVPVARARAQTAEGGLARGWIVAWIVLGIAGAVLFAVVLAGAGLDVGAHVYASAFHVIGGATLLAWALGLALAGGAFARTWSASPRRARLLPQQVALAALYWRVLVGFVVGTYATLFLSGYAA